MTFNEKHGGAAVAMYEEGMTQAAIAEHFGVTNATVRRALRARGLTARRCGARLGRVSDPDGDEVLRGLALEALGGATLRSLAEREGINPKALAARLRGWAWREWLSSKGGAS